MTVSPLLSETSSPTVLTSSWHDDTTWAEIDLDALGRNYDLLREQIGADRQIIVPVKANAYGHGATAVARYVASRGAYAVQTANVNEAVAIRQSGNPIKIIAYPTNLRSELHTLLENDIIPTVVDLQGAKDVSESASEITPIYIKVDAGLQRLGVPLAEAEDTIVMMAALPNIRVEGVYTHVPFSEMSQASWAESRIRAFESVIHRLTGRGLRLCVTQARASAHVLALMSDDLSAVCAGHLLYGLSPIRGDDAAELPCRPVLRSVKTRLIQVKPTARAEPGAVASPYGGDFQKVELTGVLPVGKANGIRRPEQEANAYVLVAGHPAPIISVTLEYTVIDLTRHQNARTGDVVTLLGQDNGMSLSLQDLARHGNSSPLDVCIGLRNVPLRYQSHS